MTNVKTFAQRRNVYVELELPRNISNGMFAPPETLEATIDEADKDWNYIIKEYGRDCKCWQEIDGKVVRENMQNLDEHALYIRLGYID